MQILDNIQRLIAEASLSHTFKSITTYSIGARAADIQELADDINSIIEQRTQRVNEQRHNEGVAKRRGDADA